MLPSFCLPPLECCLGTIPTQAEKSRPDRKAFGLATLATRAVANAGPTPGSASSRLLVLLDRCQPQSGGRTSRYVPSVRATVHREQLHMLVLSRVCAGHWHLRRSSEALRRHGARQVQQCQTRQDGREVHWLQRSVG